MVEFLLGLIPTFICSFVSEIGKTLAKNLFSDKKETTLSSAKRNKGGKLK